MTSKETHHVVRNPAGGWSVKKGGSSRASRVFETQSDAIDSAREISRNQGTRVVVHREDGRIRK